MTDGTAVSAVLATDGSESANRALVAGLRVVVPGGRLQLVTVVPDEDPSLVVGAGHSGPVMRPEQKQRMLDAEEADGRAVLADAARRLAPIEVETHLLRGDPGAAICGWAEKTGADLIVLGTSGKGGLKRAVLGSVSDYVVRNAPCPVLTVGDRE